VDKVLDRCERVVAEGRTGEVCVVSPRYGERGPLFLRRVSER
jgi:hypothetical protein